MKTTLIVTVSQEENLHPEVEVAQRKLGVSRLHHVAPRATLHEEPEKNRCINIAKARNTARDLALRYRAEQYLFLDSDVVPPPNTVEALSATGCEAVGGWFPTRSGKEWVGGFWLRQNVFKLYKDVLAGLTITDLLSLGCALISRRILERVRFRAGIDRFVQNERGEWFHIADSGEFSRSLHSMGVPAYLDGNVVCKHLNL